MQCITTTCKACNCEVEGGSKVQNNSVLYLRIPATTHAQTVTNPGVDFSLNDLLAFRAMPETLDDYKGKCMNPGCLLYDQIACDFQQKVRARADYIYDLRCLSLLLTRRANVMIYANAYL